MGRKIPARKHRGVRDPDAQREKRLLMKKIDAAPVHSDDQPIPRSAQKIAELIEKAKCPTTKHKHKGVVDSNNTKHPKKTKKLVKIQVKVAKGEKSVPKFEQRRGESDNAFLYRVNQMCENVKREAAFEKKYGVQIKRNEETGKVEGLMKRSRDPLESMVKSIREEKKNKKALKKLKAKNGGEEIQLEPKLTKLQKWKLKTQQKKEKKKLTNIDEFKQFTDNVKFGEVVHAPPSLPTPKYVVDRNEASRPGQKQLLLNSLFQETKIDTNNKPPSDKNVTSKKIAIQKTIDKRGKRKCLPIALRRALEKQQKEAIEIYKSMKLQKLENKT